MQVLLEFLLYQKDKQLLTSHTCEQLQMRCQFYLDFLLSLLMKLLLLLTHHQ